MKVIFQFDDSKAQIILSPSNGYDAANLENFQALKGKTLQVRSGANKELIVETNMSSNESIIIGKLPEPNPEQNA